MMNLIKRIFPAKARVATPGDSHSSPPKADTQPTARKSKTAGPSILSLENLRKADLPEPTPIVENFLHAGETVMVVGRPKQGKSLLMQQLALCASRGEPFLGREIQGPQRVLYLDLENSFPFVKKRFGKMSVPDAQDSNVVIYSPGTLADESLTLGSPRGLPNLKSLLEEFRPTILIVDPWRLYCGGDESKVTEMVKALRQVASLREILPDLATIIVHHLRKSQGDKKNKVKLRDSPSDWVEGASGSYSLVGHCDATFGLDREQERGKEELIVFGGVARNFSVKSVLLTHDEDDLTFSVASGQEVLSSLLTPAEDKLWEIARGLRVFTFTELLEARGNKNKDGLSKMLKKAKRQGLIQQLPDKSYRLIEQAVNQEKAA